MAQPTTHRKVALIEGPAWWADEWLTRDGGPVTDPRDDEHATRVTQAADEDRGLTAALAALPDDCVLLLAGTGGAVRNAGVWATAERRTAVRVADVALAVEIAVGLMATGNKVKALVCSVDPDLDVPHLRASGLWLQPVLPVVELTEEPAVVV